MYYITKNNVISLNRGDYLKIPLNLTTGSFPAKVNWELEEDDVVYFALMRPNQIFERAILKKEITKKDEDENGNLYIKIYPEDTINLCPGTYYYEIKAIYKLKNEEDVHIDTVVQKTKFIIVD